MAKELNKVEFLFRVLTKEVGEVLAHYGGERKLEMLEHFSASFEEWEEYFRTGDIVPLDSFTKRERELLKKYSADFKPYKDQRFELIFDFNTIFLSTIYYTKEEFKALPPQDRTLALKEVVLVSGLMVDRIDKWIDEIYLEVNGDAETMKEEEKEESDTTEMQQLLAVHYLLKAGFNIEARGSNSVSQFTQLAHLLLGKKFNTLQNSNIYKKYKKLPNFDSPAQLIKDLRHLRPYFERLELKSVVELINKDLQEAEGDKKHGKK